jgi:heme exporter protein C
MGTKRPPAESGLPPRPVGLTILTVVTVIVLAIAAYMALVYAPTEATMGAVQRIFYFHVGAAWAGALAFLVTVIAGAIYLARGDLAWDRVGSCAVEVGLALVTITLTSGPIWAQFAWGVPWTWDPKLTSAAVMWLSYAAYLMLRQSIEEPARRARFSAVYGIVAFASVIMTYFGVRFIEATAHPAIIGASAGTAQGDFGMTRKMIHAMIAGFVAFTFAFFTLLWYRIRLARLAEYVDAVRAGIMAE